VTTGSRAVATPLMQQYRDIKDRHREAILLFRMGDFYEMFYEDAEIASRVLGLTLTSRNNGGAAEVPLAGVPAKAVNEYVRRLVSQGYRVAICEQVEDPKLAKGIVRREVVETITPGAVFSDELLDGARNNFVAAVHFERAGAGAMASGPGGSEVAGMALADISTGEFRLCVASADEMDSLLARYSPREILVRGSRDPDAVTSAAAARFSPHVEGALVTERDPWDFDAETGAEELQRQFSATVEGLGIVTSDGAVVGAAGALLRYLRELQPAGVPHLARPTVERPGGVMPLDEMTRRNLELVESLRGRDGDEVAGTLLGVLDRTRTPMGARLLRQWLLAPLTSTREIDARLDAVQALLEADVDAPKMRAALEDVRDIERLAGKAAANRATPRDVRALGNSLRRLPEIRDLLERVGRAGLLGRILTGWDSCESVAASICGTLVERPPMQIGEEATVADGFDSSLDELRQLREGGKDAIARIQHEERERTGIGSLKVGYNRVFGYYIEITNTHRHLVPADYQRRQTLTGAERYITPALKEYEERVLTAAERIESRERSIFETLRSEVGAEIARLQCAARAVAELDVLSALADVAARENYARPTVTRDFDLEIVAGRHPVVERMMPRDRFIPNDVRLSPSDRVMILTGPNMAGKSTILRQVGLIAVMAQMGSFVPAKSARIGVVDRLFTRVGASDNLVRGQSTFMVEMSETSAILASASDRSLVLLDEIGRGTSTYDGVSIAWAVSEHLHQKVRCKTIFATHYHELTELAERLPAVRNFNVAVREVGDRILFLHRLQPGGADRSYGIEVGRLAGLPPAVIGRAKEILTQLEGAHLVESTQLTLFAPAPALQDPVVERLRGVDVESMTPLEAIAVLGQLATEVRQRSSG
jgi:DNA mismatch repair protein MutS